MYGAGCPKKVFGQCSDWQEWNRRMSSFKITLAAMIVAGFAMAQTGCSTLNTFADANSAPPVAGQPANGMYMVDIVPMVGKQTSYKGQIRPNMTVQNALEESQALKRMRAAEINVFRIVKGSGKTLKLPVHLQPGKKIAKFEEDYALHSGDRIVVEAKGSSGMEIFDSMFKSR
jgi:hypothetical protein